MIEASALLVHFLPDAKHKKNTASIEVTTAQKSWYRDLVSAWTEIFHSPSMDATPFTSRSISLEFENPYNHDVICQALLDFAVTNIFPILEHEDWTVSIPYESLAPHHA